MTVHETLPGHGHRCVTRRSWLRQCGARPVADTTLCERVTVKKPVRPRWDWTQVPLMLTALAAVGALVFTGLSLQATREGQITDRFSKAAELLSTQNRPEVRLGGIYALERIARDSARDHPTVMEVLSAYVRVHVRSTSCPPASPDSGLASGRASDVQAILTVIGRRDTSRDRDRLALNDTCLIGRNLVGANLTNTDLTNANLRDTRGLR
jgi:uncharacterized protein YjbI with pentapeptide repeats